MKKIFENVNGNSFKLLLTESTIEKVKGADVLREGLKKMFSQGNPEITYSNVQNMGFGFIRDVTQAKNCALQESRELALEYGYTDDAQHSKFVKENDIEHEPYIPNSKPTSENREVQIANGILQSLEIIKSTTKQVHPTVESELQSIGLYARELLQMHQ